MTPTATRIRKLLAQRECINQKLEAINLKLKEIATREALNELADASICEALAVSKLRVRD